MKLCAMFFIWIASVLSCATGMAQTSAAVAKNQFVKVGGDNIAYRSIGKGSPILLANRMRGTLDTWDPKFLDALAQRHTVITFDYPGIGYSAGSLPTDMSQVAGFVKQLSASLGLKRFALVGWSWGGYLSQTMVVEHPEMLTHAVWIGTNPPGENKLPVQQVWLERALKPVNDLSDEEILFFEPASETSRNAARLSHERIYARPNVESKIASTMDVFQLFLKGHEGFREDKVGRRDMLTRNQLPILILCGDNDTSVPVENWYPLVRKIPRAQLLVLPQSGHGPQHQYPELSARYISDFISYSGT